MIASTHPVRNQLHDPELRFRIGLDVGLSASKVEMTGQQLLNQKRAVAHQDCLIDETG
jgi:hypothetical protein